MDFQTIILRKEEGIATIILNRPEKLNAINIQMMNELKVALEDVNWDDEVRVLVLTGNGRGFCVGGDLSFDKIREKGSITIADLPNITKDGAYEDISQGRFERQRWAECMEFPLYHMPKPTIAMVNGLAFGGGFDLALSCDIRTGSEKTKFGFGYDRFGFFGETAGRWLLPRIIGMSKALELVYTGDTYSGEEAYRIGLLNRLVPSEELESETMKLARKIAEKSPIACRLIKSQVHLGLSSDHDASLAYATACCHAALYSEDFLEGLNAFVQKRQPHFKGR